MLQAGLVTLGFCGYLIKAVLPLDQDHLEVCDLSVLSTTVSLELRTVLGR